MQTFEFNCLHKQFLKMFYTWLPANTKLKQAKKSRTLWPLVASGSTPLVEKAARTTTAGDETHADQT